MNTALDKLKRWCLFLILIFTLLSVFDHITTVYIIQHGGEEANPVMRYLMNIMGVSMALTVVKVSLISFLTGLTFLIKDRKTLRNYTIIILFSNAFYILCLYFINYQIFKKIG
jgi:hypothetical protein